MKLYIWSSETFASYLHGDIISCANSIEEAREKIIAYFNGLDYYIEDDDMNSIMSDIRNDPYIMRDELVAYFNGSS